MWGAELSSETGRSGAKGPGTGGARSLGGHTAWHVAAAGKCAPGLAPRKFSSLTWPARVSAELDLLDVLEIQVRQFLFPQWLGEHLRAAAGGAWGYRGLGLTSPSSQIKPRVPVPTCRMPPAPGAHPPTRLLPMALPPEPAQCQAEGLPSGSHLPACFPCGQGPPTLFLAQHRED